MTARDGLAYECPSQSAITRPEDGMTALCIKHCTHPFVTLHNARPYPPPALRNAHPTIYDPPPPRMWTINSASAVLSRVVSFPGARETPGSVPQYNWRQTQYLVNPGLHKSHMYSQLDGLLGDIWELPVPTDSRWFTGSK